MRRCSSTLETEQERCVVAPQVAGEQAMRWCAVLRQSGGCSHSIQGHIARRQVMILSPVQSCHGHAATTARCPSLESYLHAFDAPLLHHQSHGLRCLAGSGNARHREQSSDKSTTAFIAFAVGGLPLMERSKNEAGHRSTSIHSEQSWERCELAPLGGSQVKSLASGPSG